MAHENIVYDIVRLRQCFYSDHQIYDADRALFMTAVNLVRKRTDTPSLDI